MNRKDYGFAALAFVVALAVGLASGACGSRAEEGDPEDPAYPICYCESSPGSEAAMSGELRPVSNRPIDPSGARAQFDLHTLRLQYAVDDASVEVIYQAGAGVAELSLSP